MKYIAKIDLSNKNNSHTLAYELIQGFSGGMPLKVLEVGCSSGYFGSALREIGHVVWGVEPSHDAAEAAKDILDKVFEGVLQDFFKEYPNERFNIIVFGDVLEHISNPGETLILCKSHLEADGRIVASVPNVAHISVRAMLLEGRWDYKELGILDRTHLRFFTRSSLIELFSHSAYQVLRLHSVQISAEQVDQMCGLNLNKDIIRATELIIKDAYSLDFQYVLLAKPVVDVESAIRVNSVISNESGAKLVCFVTAYSSLVELRLRLPLERWASQNSGCIKFVSIFEDITKDIEWGDIFIFQRDAGEYVFSLIKFLKSNGKKIVFEIDDLLINLPSFLSHHADALLENKEYLIESLKLSDVVTVTTSRLAKEISIYNKNIHCIPSGSEGLPSLVAKHYKVPSEEVTLIVASSDKVLIDFIIPALKLIQEKFSIQIIAIGPPGEYLENANLNIKKIKNMSYFDFKKFIASLDNGIGLIPLDDSLFSSCKSPIKYFDYSVAGIPSICSNVPPYIDYVINEKNGVLVENTTESWFAAIESLVLSHSMRTEIAESSINYVRNSYGWEAAAEAWQKVISSLMQDISLKKRETKVFSFTLMSKNKLFWITRKLASPFAYKQAFEIVKKQGIKALINRVIHR
jgi:glycosyltransferase involved in cell wall biosynthesis/2-polyprenyl-3-methyl-5-hydroxy-6-metoxy-1,4-benzoquinol methylase